MLTILVSYILLNLQKLIHEAGHFVMAKRAGIVVEEFGIGYRPHLLKLGQRHGTAYTLNALLFGGFVKMRGEKDPSVSGGLASMSKWARFKVLSVGPILNLLTMGSFVTPAIVFFALAFMSGAPEPLMGINAQGEQDALVRTVISGVVDGTPAAEAGLQVGDVVWGADDVSFKYAGDMPAYTDKTLGTEITLHVNRGGQELAVAIVPRPHPPKNQGPMGVTLSYEAMEYRTVHYSLFPALGRAVKVTAQYLRAIIWLPVDIHSGLIPAEEARPVGQSEFAQWAGSAAIEAIAENQWFHTLILLGTLSVSLVFPMVVVTAISLLPLPGWDTWRMLSLILRR